MGRNKEKEKETTMKKRSRMKLTSLLLAMVLVFSSIGLTGCFGGTAVADDTIRMMLMGDKPTGWDEVLAEYNATAAKEIGVKLKVEWVPQGDYKQKLNMKMIAGEEYDLIFDAPFLRLKDMAAEGFYADLADYFNNPEYPGLQKAFSETIVENNKFYGVNCAIPMMRALGNGIPAIHYRKDLAKKYGIGTDGQINTMDEYEEFLQAVQKNEKNMIPLGVSNTRGFYEMFRITAGDLAKKNIASVSSGGTFYVYIKDNKVAAIAAEGDGDEAFKDFPEPYNCDFAVKRYEKYVEWNKYLDPDSLNETDVNNKFYSERCASMIGTLDDTETVINQLASKTPEAELGEFIYVEAVHDMEKGAIGSGFTGNNFLCVPEASKKKDMAMKFMDWLFSSRENHDLFELGIEGKNWQQSVTGEDDRYAYAEGNEYTFPGYTMTWNSNYVRFNDILPDEVVEYRRYELDEDNYIASPLAGFTFNSTSVTTEVAKVSNVVTNVTNPLAHGILKNPIQEKQKNTAECRKKGLNVIQEEVVRQINEYLASK